MYIATIHSCIYIYSLTHWTRCDVMGTQILSSKKLFYLEASCTTALFSTLTFLYSQTVNPIFTYSFSWGHFFVREVRYASSFCNVLGHFDRVFPQFIGVLFVQFGQSGAVGFVIGKMSMLEDKTKNMKYKICLHNSWLLLVSTCLLH